MKKIVRLISNKDKFPNAHGPLTHSPPLFYQLKLLTIYDIFKLQLAKFTYNSINGIHPYTMFRFTTASELHNYQTRFASAGNLYINYNRTSKYGLKSFQALGSRFWNKIPSQIKDSVSIYSFCRQIKLLLISEYENQ